MERIPVSSSHISSVGYDPDGHVLEVEFTDGSVYQYFDVPEAEYESLMSASSHGSYLNANIKGRYAHAKL